MKKSSAKAARSPAQLKADVAAALAWLQRHSTKATRDGMARYGLPSDQALGVAMRDIQVLARQLGQDQALAEALWDSEVYEARLLVSFVGEPGRLTSVQMDRWCRDFDNWGVCDTLCFHLFNHSPLAWRKVPQWAARRGEFEKRAGFALLACLPRASDAGDEAFLACLPLIEREAGDGRNFVMKGVNWALRSIGRRSPAVHTAAVALARRLVEAEQPSARWIGKDALKDLTKPAVVRKLEKP